MIMPQHGQAAGARAAMRGNQDSRIKLEGVAPISGDIRGRNDRLYPSLTSQQQAANLFHRLSHRMSDDLAQQRS